MVQHMLHSKVQVLNSLTMSSATLFPLLFQHRMLELRYNFASTKTIERLKSILEYSLYVYLQYCLKLASMSLKRHRGGFISRGSTLFAPRYSKPLHKTPAPRMPFFTSLLSSFHHSGLAMNKGP